MPMSGIRQGAAIGIFCIALVAFMNRRPFWFAVWIILASGFHTSALLFILLLPLASGKYSRKRLAIAALLALPGSLALATSDGAEIASSRYIETGIESSGAIFRIGMLGLTAIYFFKFAKHKWKRLYPKDFSLAHIGAVAMLLSVAMIPVSSVIADRFGYYLIPIQALIFARLPYLQFTTSRKLYISLPYIGLLFIFTVWSLNSWHFQQCYIPYDTWIFGLPAGNINGF